MFYLPLSLFNFISLLIFFFFPSPQFYCFPFSMFLLPPPQFLLFSLLNNFYSPPSPPPLHLFYIFFHPQIHRPPSDRTSTPHRPYIDPTSTLHRPHIDPTSTLPWGWRESLHGSSTVKTSLGYETKGVIYLFCNISSAIKRLDFFSFRIYGGELN